MRLGYFLFTLFQDPIIHVPMKHDCDLIEIRAKHRGGGLGCHCQNPEGPHWGDGIETEESVFRPKTQRHSAENVHRTACSVTAGGWWALQGTGDS